jgi:hypothetical protein
MDQNKTIDSGVQTCLKQLANASFFANHKNKINCKNF